MRDVNRLTLTGRIVAAPKLTTKEGAQPRLDLRIAVDRNLTSAKRQEAQQHNWPTADFVDVKRIGPDAEWLAKELVKGQSVTVDGQLRIDRVERDGAWQVFVYCLADLIVPGRLPKNTAAATHEQNTGGPGTDLGDFSEDDVPF